MAVQILINLILTFIWMMLVNDFTFAGFFSGWVIGLGMLFLLRRWLPSRFYLGRVWACLKLAALFLSELVKSNLSVLIHVLRPKLQVRPGVFAYETALRTDWEVTLLSCLITLTPGTLTLEVSPDQRRLYIHAIDITDADEMKEQIRASFERAISEVTR